MKIKVIGTQIYDEHEEKVIQEYENAVIEIKDVLRIKYDGGEIISPCGKCREQIYQLNPNNLKCEILLKDRITTLEELLPEL